MQSTIRKILVVKPCALGDMILALPAIRALKRNYPGSTIDLLTNETGPIAVEGNPYIDNVIVLTAKEGADHNGKVRGLLPWYALWRRLRRQKYDLAISLRYTGRTNVMAWLTGAKIRVGYDIDGTGFLLTHSRPNLTREELLPEMQYSTALLELIGIHNIDTTLEFAVRPEAMAAARRLIAANDRKKIALNIYSTKNELRSLKEENIVKVIGRSSQLGDVYLVGSANERNYLEAIVDKYKLTAHNTAGQLTFMEVGALLSQMNLFVSGDGGALHLGRAIGVPTIALMGDGSAVQWGTYEPQNITLVSNRACVPCTITKMKCDKDQRCIDELVDDRFFALLEGCLHQ